jgi:hypothetical protein
LRAPCDYRQCVAERQTTWQDIRGLRHAPPGHAARSGRRRKTFAAALQQADDLARAAAGSGPATKPILLFYALTQAFRAFCAARLDTNWERSGHGLTVPARGGPVLDTVVKAGPTPIDLYSGVMAADGEQPFSGEVSLRELWGAHPELLDIPLPEAGVARPLRLATPGQPEAAFRGPDLLLLVLGLAEEPASRDELERLLRSYPTLESARPATPPTGLRVGPLSAESVRNGVVFRKLAWSVEHYPVIAIPVVEESDHAATFEAAAPSAIKGRDDVRWLVPGIGQPPRVLDPVSYWWLLLLALSSLARYQPAAWVAALDIDKSAIAVGLERVLETAEASLPHYIYEALGEELPK